VQSSAAFLISLVDWSLTHIQDSLDAGGGRVEDGMSESCSPLGAVEAGLGSSTGEEEVSVRWLLAEHSPVQRSEPVLVSSVDDGGCGLPLQCLQAVGVGALDCPVEDRAALRVPPVDVCSTSQ
jgi:hypothetical protein